MLCIAQLAIDNLFSATKHATVLRKYIMDVQHINYSTQDFLNCAGNEQFQALFERCLLIAQWFCDRAIIVVIDFIIQARIATWNQAYFC